ncbi:hypothetical protein BDV96DRAFT_178264 [Lophiotrema nucula]|uniref:Uncharacterized protein n=1 Tax=Lophiotrema nucula TaxID=690887 RepID=A0A6A5YY17_9PLEO|nr:hypothetical protein BDV96DRAFT_178264 [Lophiotrema nucula]
MCSDSEYEVYDTDCDIDIPSPGQPLDVASPRDACLPKALRLASNATIALVAIATARLSLFRIILTQDIRQLGYSPEGFLPKDGAASRCNQAILDRTRCCRLGIVRQLVVEPQYHLTPDISDATGCEVSRPSLKAGVLRPSHRSYTRRLDPATGREARTSQG